MIEGVVNAAHEAVVALHLQGPEGRTRDIEAVVDTGFSGFLTLPTVLVAELGLHFAYTGQAFLANDDEVSFDVHDVTVLWDGHRDTSKPWRLAPPHCWAWRCSTATT